MPIRTKISGTVCLARNYMASEALRVIKTRNFSETKMRRYSSVCKCNISKSENNHTPQLKSEIFGVAQARKKIYYYYYFFKIKILYIERAFFSTNASVNDFKLNYNDFKLNCLPLFTFKNKIALILDNMVSTAHYLSYPYVQYTFSYSVDND